MSCWICGPDKLDWCADAGCPYRMTNEAKMSVASGQGWELRHGAYQDVMQDVTTDLWIADTPYSAKTHKGHDAGTAGVQPSAAKRGYVKKSGSRAGDRETVTDRRIINYAAWTPDDVRECVEFWAPRTRGWMVSLTDDVLFPVWRDAMADAGRVVFQDVPVIISGMTVRLSGDGPSSWAIHLAVSRPRTREFATWGTLSGGYYGPSEAQVEVGGKPLWLLRALVRDYSRHGDTIADCCAGGATAGIAALKEGRRFIGSEIRQEAFDKSVARLSKPFQISLLTQPPPAIQTSLLDM